MIKKDKLLWLIALGLFFVLQNNTAFAQGKVGVSVSPVRFELTANPGDMINNKIKVSNPTGSTISIKMIAEDFKPIGEEGQVVVDIKEEEPERKVYSLKSWIKMIPSEFVLGPDETKAIDFLIEIPMNAEPGVKYGSVLPTITGSVGQEFTGATVSSSVASLVLLTVSGDVKEDLVIEDFSAPSFLEYSPVPFAIRFKNEGTVHVKPRGFITITDMWGNKVKDLEFPQNNVIPDSIRKIEAKWDNKWIIGKFTATIIGSYGMSNIPITPKVITFTVLPWKILSFAFVIAFFFGILFYKSRKRLKLAAKILLKGNTN